MKHFIRLFFYTALLFVTAQSLGASPELAAGVAIGINAFSYIFITPQAGVLGLYVGATNDSSGEDKIQVIATERDRAILTHNQNKPEFVGKDLTPSYLRLETEIVNGKNELIFKTFEGDGATVYATEKRLDRNDAFIATEVGIFLLRQDVANAKTIAEPHSYVNLTTFVAAAGFVPADLRALFHGQLKVSVDRKQQVIGLDTYRFWKVPETQQTGATNYDQKDGSKDGFVKLTPQIVLDGNGTNEISLVYPSYAGWQGASVTVGTTHRVALWFRGLLVPNGNRK